MKTIINKIIENKAIVSIIILSIFYSSHSFYINSVNAELESKIELFSQPSEIEMVANELKNLRENWYNKEQNVISLRKTANNVEKQKLDLEPLIREKQSELDTLTWKKSNSKEF